MNKTFRSDSLTLTNCEFEFVSKTRGYVDTLHRLILGWSEMSAQFHGHVELEISHYDK